MATEFNDPTPPEDTIEQPRFITVEGILKKAPKKKDIFPSPYVLFIKKADSSTTEKNFRPIIFDSSAFKGGTEPEGADSGEAIAFEVLATAESSRKTALSSDVRSIIEIAYAKVDTVFSYTPSGHPTYS